MSRIKVKNCPRCGAERKDLDWGYSREGFTVFCRACGQKGHYGPSAYGALREWNSRSWRLWYRFKKWAVAAGEGE